MIRNLMKSALLLAAFMLPAQAQAADDVLPITIGAAAATSHAPLFAGIELGIFAKHGLDAKLEMYQTGVDMVNGLLNGAQHVNTMGSVPYLSGVARGFPLVLIGHLHGDPTADNYAANISIVSSAASGIGEGDFASFSGKTIGVPRGSGAEGYLLGVLAANGLSESDVNLVNVPPAELVTALNQNDVDAISIWEPWGSTAMTKVEGAVRVIQGDCPTCYDPGTILTTHDIIAADSEVLQRFMAALSEAQQWVRNNLDEASVINTRWIQGVDIDTMKLAIRAGILDPRMSTYTVDMYMEKTLPFLMSLGRIEEVYDPTDAIDFTFMRNVQAEHPELFDDLPAISAELTVK